MNDPVSVGGLPESGKKSRQDPGMFVGREGEVERLREAIERRTGLAIWGPADAGKTALVRHVLARLPRAMARSCVYRRVEGPPHALLCGMLEQLYERGDGFLKAKFRGETGRGAEFGRWAEEQSSLRMRGLLYRAGQEGGYSFFLDDVNGFSDAFVRIVKELSEMRGCPVYLLARGYTERELGRAARLYWNDELRLSVGPLGPAAARRLLEHCIRRYGLTRLNLDGFREGVLRFSGRLPGAIVKMCARAAEPQYQFGDRIETRLLHVDYMMQFSFRGERAARAAASAGDRAVQDAGK